MKGCIANKLVKDQVSKGMKTQKSNVLTSLVTINLYT